MNPQQLVTEILAAAAEVKAEDPKVLDLRQLTSFTDYFVILSGRSDRQVQAIADRVIEVLGQKKNKPLGIEGYDTGHWILLDFGPVVAHIFYHDTRDFYDLERLWSDAPRVETEMESGKAQP